MAIETVDELIEELEQYRGKKLRAAVQPSYPMGASVVAVAEKERGFSYGDDDEEVEDEDKDAGSVYVVISDNEDYSAERSMWRGW